MTTLIVQPEEGEWFADDDRIMSTTKREDEKKTYTWDYTQWLASKSNTIASVAFDASGVTVESSSNTTTTVTAQISGVGSLEITLTLSSPADEDEFFYCFYSSDTRSDDYGR